jgi:hypothetical protein
MHVGPEKTNLGVRGGHIVHKKNDHFYIDIMYFAFVLLLLHNMLHTIAGRY